jgi:hypothetical protein
VLDPGPDPAEAAAPTPATGPRSAAYRTSGVHQTLLNLCALGLVVTVIPLVVLQIPDAVAWVVPPRVAAAGPGAVASLLRASGLALPAMAVAGSLAALMVRWLRAGPVLLAGLLILAAADALGGLVRTVVLIGADRSLHGAGAGLALLTAPVAGICAIALAVTYPGGQAVTAAAVADALALAGIAAITARAATAARFAAVCAVTGFTVSPAGVVILLAGVVVGYLAAGAVQLHAIAGAVTAPAARAALASAAGHWALVAAAVTGAVALAMACTPVRGAGGIMDHG